MSSSGFLGGGIGPTAIKRRSGLAAPVPVAGAELIVNGSMETGDPPANYTLVNSTLSAAADERTGGGGAQSLKIALDGSFQYARARQDITLAPESWYAFSYWRKNADATNGVVAIIDASALDQALYSAATQWNLVAYVGRRSSSATARLEAIVRDTTVAAGRYALIDDVSCKPLTLSSLFSTRTYGSANCDLSAAVTRTAGTQAGLVARLDSATSPANFIIAYLDGAGNVKVDKCVAGVYTTVINGAVTYGSTKILRLVCSGNSVSAYYDGAQVGSTVTVSDAGIVSNTRHGLFSTYAANSFAGYVAA